MLGRAFVDLGHCGSILMALCFHPCPPGPLLSFLGLHPHCSLLLPPLELPRLLLKQPRQAGSSFKASALVAPSAWEAHSLDHRTARSLIVQA